MAADFIGAHMLVTLREPPTSLRGVVSDVKSGCSLTLSNVWSVDGSVWLQSHLIVDAANVVNLVEIPAAAPPLETPTTNTRTPIASTSTCVQNTGRPSAPASSAAPSRPPTIEISSLQSAPPASSIVAPASNPAAGVPFRDPAIIAVGKPPPAGVATHPSARDNKGSGPASRQGKSAQEIPGTSAAATSIAASAAKPSLDTPRISVHGPDPVASDLPYVDAEATSNVPGKKKSRRPRANRGGRATATTQEDARLGQDVINEQAAAHGTKGWRQTPMLEDTSSFQPYNALKKGRGRKANALQHESGWASEDVTDVQELGEFDFEGGLAKFDKHTLFDQMRKDDQVDDANRLVSHNRQPRPKPGTSGGRAPTRLLEQRGGHGAAERTGPGKPPELTER
ncbi:YjeF_N domain-containing protein [Magnaporthiopsis poae ATCC 64411]|uniref:YjeF_N domain-containing protein n=1 Tax=Magnaporthiopsis poae (strain ATCC 64411 / 73-15) TaxID=644358 RepID=A0A0C4E6A2_MAGP6|nr:YjeF_N domain-containing protein [Magnaporthiopsis poae ATCC 64411]